MDICTLRNSVFSLFRRLPQARTTSDDETAIRVLSQVARALASSLQGVSETQTILTEAVIDLLNTQRSVLLVPQGSDLVAVAASGVFDGLQVENLRLPQHGSAIGKTFVGGDSYCIDVADETRQTLPPGWGSLKIKSLAAVPMKIQNETIGVIVTDTKRDGKSFTALDLRVLEVFATLASLVTSEAKLIDDLRARNAALESLFELAKKLNSQTTSVSILQMALNAAISRTGASSGSIVYVDRDRKELIIKSSEGLPANVTSELRLEIGQGVTGWVAREGKSVRIDDVQVDARYIAATDNVRSELAVPISIDGEVAGVINVDSPLVGAFSAAQQTYLEALADLSAAKLRLAFAEDSSKS